MRMIRTDKEFFGGIDLHSKSMVVCIINRKGDVLLMKRIPCDFKELLELIHGYKTNIALGVESTFNWYWLVDACRENNIEIHLGHAGYIKAIHANKNKNDRLDARTLANLLRTQYFPIAYAYPSEMRTIRDLLRRRQYLVHMRSGLVAHVRTACYQHGITEVEGMNIQTKKSQKPLADALEGCLARETVGIDISLLESMRPIIDKLEKSILSQARHVSKQDLALLESIPGVGRIISLVILYETHTIERFQRRQRFASYCRLVKPERESCGKSTGGGNRKMGNPYLKWAFMEILNIAPRYAPPIHTMYQRQVAKHGKLKARAILAHRFAVAVFYMLKHKEPFDIKRFANA